VLLFMKTRPIKRIQAVLAVVVLLAANMALMEQRAAAAYLTQTQIILTNMNASGASAIIFSFRTSATNTGNTLTISLPTYTGGANGTIAGSPTYATTYNSATCTSITGASASVPGSPPTVSGNSVTGLFTFSSITAYTANTTYCGVITGAITSNPTAAPTSTTAVITAGTDSATSQGIYIVANDQVVVSATVPPAFSMAIAGGGTDTFTANLSSGAIRGTNGVAVTINTNATTGWSLWGSDGTTGIRSTTQSHTIPSLTPGSNGTLTIGTENYLSGLPAAGITQGSGAGTTSASVAYASSGLGNGSGLDTVPRKMASSTGTANGAIVTVYEYAAISGITPAAGDYSDTITLVGAGSF
jgi:hypothetical protein